MSDRTHRSGADAYVVRGSTPTSSPVRWVWYDDAPLHRGRFWRRYIERRPAPGCWIAIYPAAGDKDGDE